MNIWTKIKNLSLYPGAYTYLTMLSHFNWIKSLTKKEKVVFESPYKGQKIFLLVLYEKGILRKDIEKLLKVAKNHGAYTICINTLKLANPEQYNGLMDCYIERYNFGRDFGSYKTGYMHLYKQQWDKQCPRLLMLNDSLYYSKKNLANFIADLLNTEIEVLGATENHEIQHHLGSFCLSLDGAIIRNGKFRSYWKKYSNSDVRPIVIKRGEMELSKTLRRCVSSPDSFSALFDLAWLSDYINNNPEFLDTASDLYRASDFVDWKRPSLKGATERLVNKYMTLDPVLENLEVSIEVHAGENTIYFVDSPSQLQKLICTSAEESEVATIDCRVYEEVKNDLLECFSAGSQIHQNGIILHYLGLPIIKLDGLYRGIFSTEDVEKLAQQLESSEVMQFKRLMYSKPFGGNVLFGWKRAAFYRGLI